MTRSPVDGNEVAIAVDDPSTGGPQTGGSVFPGRHDWDHIPECGPDDLAVWVRWERSGTSLVGQIIVENVSGHSCRLSHEPWLVPLRLDGSRLPVEVVITADFRTRPVILARGRRAAAPVGWAGWCGDPASGVVRVEWGSGSAEVEVDGPRQPDCPDSGHPTNISSSWFEFLE
jgi:hypothetical protein